VTDVITEVETAAMLTLKGVHGTSRTAAQEIVQHQIFQKTDKGRVGTGVYFWRENIYAKELAICWYDYRVRKGDFKSNEGAVIYMQIFASRRMNFGIWKNPPLRMTWVSLLYNNMTQTN